MKDEEIYSIKLYFDDLFKIEITKCKIKESEKELLLIDLNSNENYFIDKSKIKFYIIKEQTND